MMPAPAAKTAVEKPSAPVKLAESAPRAYAVQLGVFSNPANALQLQERLTQNGIKSHTETRLNVGPFQNKVEADQALAKIRAMGISAVMVPVR
ncbi:MAG: sporulation protein [Hyphomonas sp. 32-62-5]|nr:MAG: sporulation protein [Hyphomonas sp. 32-62-5]